MIAGVVVLVLAPFVSAHIRTESAKMKNLDEIESNIPENTTALMAFFSVESEAGTCWSTTAQQLATTESAESVAASFRKKLDPDAKHTVAWFHRRKVVAMDLDDPEHQHAQERDVETFPFAARFLMNVHAFLPKGTRRVVVFSREQVTSSLEVRCW